MNELEMIKSQLQDINNKRVKYETLIEQAKKQCQEIEQKYNIKSEEELKILLDNAQIEYEKELQNANQYIEDTNKQLSNYQGLLC